MSFNQIILENISATIDKYHELLSSKYGLNKNELKNLWFGISVSSSSPTKTTTTTTTTTNTIVSNELEKMTKTELIELCKNKKFDVDNANVEIKILKKL